MHRNKQKKGISTIIAALFTVAVIIVGLNAMTYVSTVQNSLAQVATQKNFQSIQRISEQLQLRGITIKNNQFNITLYNTGSLPVHLVKMWVTNNTATNWHQSWDLSSKNYYLNPRNSTRNIGQSLTPVLYANTGKTYTFSFVTERGTIATYKLAGGSDAQLFVQLVASPPTIPAGESVTVQMIVQHNNTLADAVANISPNAPTVTINPSTDGTAMAILMSGPTPVSYSNILSGSSKVFTWTYQLSGQNGTSFTFTGSLTNSQSNTAAPVTVTLNGVKITSTTYALNSGVLSMSYTSFQWTQGGGWNKGWSIPSGTAKTAFKVDVTNNNASGTLWLSKNTSFIEQIVGTAGTTPFFIVNMTDASTTPPTNTAYCSGTGDFCGYILPNGKLTIYLAANAQDVSTGQSIGGQAGKVTTIILLVFGKFATCGSCSGAAYGQNLPFIGVELT